MATEGPREKVFQVSKVNAKEWEWAEGIHGKGQRESPAQATNLVI